MFGLYPLSLYLYRRYYYAISSISNSPLSKGLLSARAVYFLYYAAMSSLLPYLALYFNSLGISGSRTGLLLSSVPLVSLLAGPLWGGLSDATRQHRRFLLGAIAGLLVAVWGLSRTHTFWTILPAVVCFALFNAPISALVDNSVMALLGDQREAYGRQRLWGAIGWGISAPLVGRLADLGGLGWTFNSFLVCMAGTFCAAWFLPVSRSRLSAPFWSALRRLVADRRLVLFLLVVFLNGITGAVLTNYLFPYLEGQGASRAQMGLALAIGTLSEVPALFFSGRLLARWGASGVLLLSLAASVVRAVGYSYASAPWQALLLQLFHGVTFSLLWAAGVVYAAQLAPPELGATAQSLFTSTLMGLGGISGALLGGYLIEQVGGGLMFRWSALGALLGLVLLGWQRLGWRAYRPYPHGRPNP